jgi:hypothetical protein
MENAQQLAQLLAQQGQQPQTSNPMDWLKSFIKPATPAGALANQDPYSAYVLQAIDSGQNPMPRMEYMKMMEQQQMAGQGGQGGI